MSVAYQTPSNDAPPGAQGACDVSVILPGDFRLASGEKLSKPEIRLRLFGESAKPAIAVAGGISADRNVADVGGESGWWRDIVSRTGPISLADYCVIGFDFLPNPGEAARTISSADQARSLALALAAINIPCVKAFVGASYGGMVALAFAEEFPDRLEKLCVISAADRPHPSATALRGVQRRIIDFASRCGAPEEGVSLARQIAMVTYRTPEEFERRFRHAPGEAAGEPYDVCRYLISRGEAYQSAPERYVTLSDSIDRHSIEPARITAPSLFLAALSDRLVPPADIRRVAERVRDGRFVSFNSPYGHDAFLKETSTIGPIIKSFIEEERP